MVVRIDETVSHPLKAAPLDLNGVASQSCVDEPNPQNQDS